MVRGRLQVWLESCIRAGHISFADWIEAETDDAVISQAGTFGTDANICEVWRRERVVARLNQAGEVQRSST